MPLRYKFKPLDALKAAGFTTYRLTREGKLSASTLQKLRTESPVSWENIDRLCELLSCQPGDLLEHIPADK